MYNTADRAIRAALEGKWEEAIEENLELLRKEPDDIPALNRLGHAYTEQREIEKAREAYKKVLSLDRYNPIATRSLKRLKAREKITSQGQVNRSIPSIHANFLEEPGKTKTTQLVRLADREVIASLNIGQPVLFDAKKRAVSVKTEAGTYIGTLPDDLSYRLGRFIRGGNKYMTVIKGLPESRGVQIFIRESERGKRFKNIPSFPATTSPSYHTELRYAILKETPIDTRQTGEDEDA